MTVNVGGQSMPMRDFVTNFVRDTYAPAVSAVEVARQNYRRASTRHLAPSAILPTFRSSATSSGWRATPPGQSLVTD
jgi:hypothetical protein